MKKRNLSFALALVMLALALAGCAGPAVEAQSTTITVTDMAGRTVTLEKAADRIVALTAGDCEILYAIGAGDTLVGRGEYCNYPTEVLDVSSVESGYETNIEQIIALAPDAILMAKMAQTVEQVEALQNAGIAVIVTDAQTIDGVYEEITLVGKVTGRDAEAAALIESMKAGFADTAANAADNAGKTVYFEVSPLQYGLWTAGSDTFMDEIAEMLGLENAFADLSGWAEVSEEQVIARDPDYIVTIAMYFGEGLTPVEEIVQRAGWQGMKAIKNGNVYNADSDMISRPGPRLADAAADFGAFIRGE